MEIHRTIILFLVVVEDVTALLTGNLEEGLADTWMLIKGHHIQVDYHVNPSCLICTLAVSLATWAIMLRLYFRVAGQHGKACIPCVLMHRYLT